MRLGLIESPESRMGDAGESVQSPRSGRHGRIRITRARQQPYWATWLLAILIAGCVGTPGSSVYNATTIVYTEGASQDTVAVELPVAPPDVFASMSRIVDNLPDVEVLSRNDKAYQLEVSSDQGQVTLQATDLGDNETLLFVWADGRSSGRTGEDLALSAVKRICDDLDVTYELVTP